MPALQRVEGFLEPGGPGSADTRARIIISVLASIMTVALGSLEGQGVLFGSSLLYALSVRRFRVLFVAYAFITGLFLLALGCSALIHIAAQSLPQASLGSFLLPFLRFAIMINAIIPLAFGTPVQSLLRSLKAFRLPFQLYIPLAVMIRFIPTFITDVRQIAEALRIRGYRLSGRQLLLHPVLSMRFVTVPLLFRALKTSEDLGVAAELKGLSPEKTFRPWKAPAWQKRDSLLLLLALAAALAALLCEAFFGTGLGGGHP